MQRDAGADAMFPVGTVLPFAGPVSTAVPQGWLVCDGSSYTQSAQQELFDAIGFGFGGGSGAFNVPDLTGRFVRALAGPPDSMGTQEAYQTALPSNVFQTGVGNLGNGDSFNYAENITTEYTSAWCASSESAVIQSGGDLETVPKNKSVYFLIKSSSLTSAGTPVSAPVGSVVAYSGATTPGAGHWAPCCGQQWPTQGKYAALFQAIGFAHGQSGSLMVLPDYQGYFLRGVDTTGNIDKYAGTRTAPGPNGTGNAGGSVGSCQGMYTGLPTSNAFTLIVQNPPDNNNGTTSNAGASVVGSPTWVPLTSLTTTGGDPETIPKNYAVDFYIATNPPLIPSSDGLPVGAIIYVAAALTTSPPGYLPCNGASLPVAAYEALYSAIGYAFGPNNNNGSFPLPNYANIPGTSQAGASQTLTGFFLRGLDRSKKVDVSPRVAVLNAAPAASMGELGTVQAFATAMPGNPFTGSVPTGGSSDAGPGAEEDSTEYIAGGIFSWSGGDPETCPVNMHLACYIKVTA